MKHLFTLALLVLAFPQAASAGVTQVDLTQLNQLIANQKNDSYLIVDFTATWCGPCRQFAPKLDAYAEKMSSFTTYQFVKIDIKDWESPVSAKFKIEFVPQMIVFHRGLEYRRLEAHELIPFLDELKAKLKK